MASPLRCRSCLASSTMVEPASTKTTEPSSICLMAQLAMARLARAFSCARTSKERSVNSLIAWAPPWPFFKRCLLFRKIRSLRIVSVVTFSRSARSLARTLPSVLMVLSISCLRSVAVIFDPSFLLSGFSQKLRKRLHKIHFSGKHYWFFACIYASLYTISQKREMEKNIIMRHMSRTTFQEGRLRFCHSCIQHSTSKLEMQ